MRKTGNPLIADVLGHPVGQQRIPVQQEPPLCDTVCLIIELLREQIVKIAELLIFQDLRVQFCHTVHRVSGCNRQMRHFYLSVINNCHPGDLSVIPRKTRLNL